MEKRGDDILLESVRRGFSFSFLRVESQTLAFLNLATALFARLCCVVLTLACCRMMMRNLRMLFELVPLAAVLVPQLVKGDVGQPGEIEKAEDLKVYITASSPFFYWTSFFLACFVCAVLHRMANRFVLLLSV